MAKKVQPTSKVVSALSNLKKSLPPPANQYQHILREMILSDAGVAERDFNYNMFRGYISLIRRVVSVKDTNVPFVNTFGRKNTYVRHWLTDTEKIKACRHYFKTFKKIKKAA